MSAYFSFFKSEATLDRLAINLKQAQKKNDIVNAISEKELSLLQFLGVENRIDADEKFAGINLLHSFKLEGYGSIIAKLHLKLIIN